MMQSSSRFETDSHSTGTACVSLLFQMEKKKQENKMRRDQLNDEYLELLDKQRLYFKTVKDFKEVRKACA